MRILILQRAATSAPHFVQELQSKGYDVEVTARLATFSELARTKDFAAAVVEIGHGQDDRLQLIQMLRGRGCALSILILSERTAVIERVQGLEVGADDYLCLPCDFSELLARLQALARRAVKVIEPEIAIEDLRIDMRKRRVTRSGKGIRLQPREYALLEYLARNAGRVVSKDEIIKQVWHYQFDPCTNVVASRVCRLREKVDAGFGLQLIHTLKGQGYVLRSGARLVRRF